jgi:hypothetical protein
MQALCRDKTKKRELCEDNCDIYTTCPLMHKCEINVDAVVRNMRIQEGRCLECGGMLCEHRLTYKEGHRRF